MRWSIVIISCLLALVVSPIVPSARAIADPLDQTTSTAEMLSLVNEPWGKHHPSLHTDFIMNSAFQPGRSSIYGTFYYPWYKNLEVDGDWSHWQSNNHSPPSNWFSNFLPLPPGTLNPVTGTVHPSNGLYSSNDKNIFYWQITKMAQARMEFAISSWWGRSVSPASDLPGQYALEGKSDFSFRQIITEWMNLADNPYPNLRWAIYYEREGYENPSPAEIASDLTYVYENYALQPAFLRRDGRPVVFIYADADDDCHAVNRWMEARDQAGIDFYLVMKLFPGYELCRMQPDSWHQYAPAVRLGHFPPYSSFLSPGFWKKGEPARLSRNLEEFDAAAAEMVAADTEWKLVQTWNEWGEGSSIEPGIQVQSLTTGTVEIAPESPPFEDHYIRVLANRLPPLEAGTGATAQTKQSMTTTAKMTESVPAQADSFVFGAGGDIGANARSDATLRAIPTVNPAFFLALGDMDYDEISPDTAWCGYVKDRVGGNLPFEIVTGNHEEGSATSPASDGYIGNHASCLPDYFNSSPVIPGMPAYPANYYFDYPQTNPFMRVIMISANLTYDGFRYNFNTSEQTNYNALAATIDAARQADLWIVVGLHKVCLSTGNKSCEIGADLLNLLIDKKVDLVLQGHEHNYQRSKQIALGSSCPRVVPGSYDPDCIVDDGSDNTYTRGAGTIFLINGNMGRCCYNVRSNDSEAGYFAVLVGSTSVDTNGFVAYSVSPTRIDAQVINSVGTWGDNFSIVREGPPRLPPKLVGPNGPITTNPPTFVWNAVPEAVAYELQYDTVEPPNFSVNTGTLRHTPPFPLFMEPYFWRVRARFADGEYSDWSPTLNFIIESAAGAAPQLHYHTTASPVLTWNRITWATEYEVQVSIEETFTPPLSFTAVVPANTLGLPTQPLENGSYYWRIRAKRGDGTWGPWSEIGRFIVDVP